MKKRMFLSTILMTLVLLVAVTTATFAWYSASSGNATLSGHEDLSITTSDATYSVSAGTIKVTLSNPTQKVGPTNQAGEIKYIVNGAPTDVTPSGEYLTKGQVTWTVSFEGADAAVDDQAELALYAGDYTLTITGTGARLHAADESVIAAADNATYVIKITVTAEGTFAATTGTAYFAVNSDVTESTAVTLDATLTKGYTA